MSDWRIKELGTLCTIQLGKTPARGNKKLWDTEKVSNNVWLSIADLEHGEKISDSKEYISDTAAKSIKIVPKGTLMVSFKLTLGRTSFAGRNLFTNEAIASLKNLSKEIDKNYLNYYFTHFDWDKASESDIKVKGRTLNKAKLSKLPILCPSLTTQKKIVSKLDQAFEAIDQAIANTEKNIENVEDLRDSYSEQCFKKFPSKSIEIGEVCQLFQGLAVNAKTKHLLVESSSLPLLRIKDLRENTVSQFISEEGYPPNSLIDDEDIIYTRTGSLGLVFRGRRGVLHNNSFKVSPKDSLSKDFLFHYLQLPSFKKKIFSLAQRAAQPDITHKIFKKQMLPMFNHENQKIIVHQVEAIKEECSRLKEIQVRKLAMLEKLKMSILEKAFNGELV